MANPNVLREWKLVSLLLLLSLPGCGGANPESKLAQLNKSNLQRIVNLYFAYQKKHSFQGPPDEAAFKAFIEGYSVKKLERIGVDPSSIDELFVSSRDGQPFRIRYGVLGSSMGCDEPVAFEAEGQAGMRRIGFLNLTQREVDSTEYDSLWSGKGGGGPSTRGIDKP